MTHRFGVALAMVLMGPSFVSAQQLVPATAPRLVNCNNKPCFRITVNALDAEGRPIAIETATGGDRGFEITEGAQRYKPFFLSALDEPTSTARGGTYWMLLLDLSGSMRTRLGAGTRFDAALEAIRGAISEFKEGQDHFALVPFESHRVRETVASATFVSTRAEALQRLALIKPPPATNNTALYSAGVEALEGLRKYEQQGNDVSLVIFTDGKNDVHPERGDDPGLLGPEGLAQLRERARDYNVQVNTIGFGARGDASFDETALRQMAWPDERHYVYARDAEGVRRILTSNAQALATRVNLTFGAVRENKGQLRGQTLSFSIAAKSGGKPIATTSPVIWSAPAIQEPSFVAVLNPAEQKAFDRENGPDFEGPNRWIPRLTAFGIFGLVLAVGWFGLPRLVWPERYIPKPNFPALEGRPGKSQGGQPGAPSRHEGPKMDPRARPSASVVARGEELPSAVKRTAPRAGSSRRPAPPRDPDDATVYIPRGKKFEQDS